MMPILWCFLLLLVLVSAWLNLRARAASTRRTWRQYVGNVIAIAIYTLVVAFAVEYVRFVGFWSDYAMPLVRLFHEFNELAESEDCRPLREAVRYFDSGFQEKPESSEVLNRLVYDVVNREFDDPAVERP